MSLLRKTEVKVSEFNKLLLNRGRDDILLYFKGNATTREKHDLWLVIDSETKEKMAQVQKSDEIVQIVGHIEGNLDQLELSEEFLRENRPLTYKKFGGCRYRRPEMHTVNDFLLQIWRSCLTNKEKYFFWFKFFSAGDRSRLWNKLVFAREWFRRTINFSK